MIKSIQAAAIIATGWWPLIGSAGPTTYIPLGAANQIIAVDAATHQIIAQYTGVENPHGLVVTPDGRHVISTHATRGDGKTLFVSSKKAETLTVLDIGSGKMRTVPLAPAPIS